ncbi:MAG: preprotein translocase subunit SecG [Candidatus Riesia sp.]|nr:preprotein translocase subunit SecG [Candidatus Riesia sp.]
MLNFLLLMHIFCSIFLIFLVLLNQGKGSELGAINQNNELLSNRNSSLIINRIIIIIALLTVLTNVLLSYYVKSYNIKQNVENLVEIPKYIFFYYK